MLHESANSKESFKLSSSDSPLLILKVSIFCNPLHFLQISFEWTWRVQWFMLLGSLCSLAEYSSLSFCRFFQVFCCCLALNCIEVLLNLRERGNWQMSSHVDCGLHPCYFFWHSFPDRQQIITTKKTILESFCVSCFSFFINSPRCNSFFIILGYSTSSPS